MVARRRGAFSTGLVTFSAAKSATAGGRGPTPNVCEQPIQPLKSLCSFCPIDWTSKTIATSTGGQSVTELPLFREHAAGACCRIWMRCPDVISGRRLRISRYLPLPISPLLGPYFRLSPPRCPTPRLHSFCWQSIKHCSGGDVAGIRPWGGRKKEPPGETLGDEWPGTRARFAASTHHFVTCSMGWSCYGSFAMNTGRPSTKRTAPRFLIR